MRREFDREREPQVRQCPRTDDRGSSRIGTDDARRARRAVKRCLQLAQQIVMLERGRREEDGVNCQPDECEPAAREIREALQIRLKPDPTYDDEADTTMIQPNATDELPRGIQH